MASNQATNEKGFVAAATLKRPYWSTYLHIPSKKVYRQVGQGTTNNWEEVGEASSIALTDLSDVSLTVPIQDGDILVYNSTTNRWENQPLQLLEGKTNYVDSVYGDDATAEPNSMTKKYKTIQAAVANAGLPFVSGASSVVNGTGYPQGVPTQAGVTGGSGEGLIVLYTDFFGFFTTYSIVDPGTGYLNGEVVTVNGGDNNKTFQITTSLSEDTVVIGAGTYTTTGNIAKENVTLHSDHNPLIQGSTTILSDNGGAIPFIKVTGNIRFEMLGFVNPINISGTDTKYQIDCESWIVKQGIRILSNGGPDKDSYIHATEFIRNDFGVNYVFTFGTGGLTQSDSVCNIYTKKIDSTAAFGGLRIMFNVNTIVNGKINIYVDELVSNTTTPQSIMVWASGGLGSINIKGYSSEYATIKDNPLSPSGSNFFWNAGVFQVNGELNIKANIYQRQMFMFRPYSNNGQYNIEGTIYNESDLSIWRRDGGTGYFNFKGTLHNISAPTAIMSKQTAGDVVVNGTIYQKRTVGEGDPGGVAVLKLLAGGTGVPIQTFVTNVATTYGGTGTGCEVMLLNANTGSQAENVWVTNPGDGYTVGDVLTAVYGGNDITFTVEAIEPTAIGVLNNATDVIIDDLKVVNDQPASYAFQGITPGSPTDLRVTKVLTTNVTSINYTDLIPGSLKIENTNVE
jgi:hypothetical protein